VRGAQNVGSAATSYLARQIGQGALGRERSICFNSSRIVFDFHLPDDKDFNEKADREYQEGTSQAPRTRTQGWLRYRQDGSTDRNGQGADNRQSLQTRIRPLKVGVALRNRETILLLFCTLQFRIRGIIQSTTTRANNGSRKMDGTARWDSTDRSNGSCTFL